MTEDDRSPPLIFSMNCALPSPATPDTLNKGSVGGSLVGRRHPGGKDRGNIFMGQIATSPRNDGTGIVELDPWLEPYSQKLRDRFNSLQARCWRRSMRPAGCLGRSARATIILGLTAANRGEAGRLVSRVGTRGPATAPRSATSTAGTTTPTQWRAMNSASGACFSRTKTTARNSFTAAW